MKKILCVLLTLVLLSSLGSALAAGTVYTEGTLYYTIGNGTITIVGSFGRKTEVTVPAMIAGVPVNTIAAGAFSENRYLQTLNLPDTITTIEDGAIGSGVQIIYNSNTEYPSLVEPELLNEPVLEAPKEDAPPADDGGDTAGDDTATPNTAANDTPDDSSETVIPNLDQPGTTDTSKTSGADKTTENGTRKSADSGAEDRSATTPSPAVETGETMEVVAEADVDLDEVIAAEEAKEEAAAVEGGETEAPAANDAPAFEKSAAVTAGRSRTAAWVIGAAVGVVVIAAVCAVVVRSRKRGRT